MNIAFNYGVFHNQVPNNWPADVPILASVFVRTPYYLSVSSSNFYDIRISTEFQAFSPYLNFSVSKYSAKTSQCFISLARSGRWKLSPWFRFDPKFSSKYTRLYICHIIQRNYFWIDLSRNRLKVFHCSGPNLFDLNPLTLPLNLVFQSPSWVRNSYVGTILDPMMQFNIMSFRKSRKKLIQWPYNNFVSRFLTNFFQSGRARGHDSIVANGVVGPHMFVYRLYKKQIVSDPIRASWSKFIRREVETLFKPLQKFFYVYKYLPNYHKMRKLKYKIMKRFPKSRRHFRAKPVMAHWNYNFSLFVQMSRGCRTAQSQTLELGLVHRRAQRKSLRNSSKSKALVSIRRSKSKFGISAGGKKIPRILNRFRGCKKPTSRTSADFIIREFQVVQKRCLRYARHSQIGLRTRFVRLHIRMIMFLNFVDRYWVKSLSFGRFVRRLEVSRRVIKLHKFIRGWFKLRLSRQVFRPHSKKMMFRGSRMIRNRVGFQFRQILPVMARIFSRAVELQYGFLGPILWENLVFQYVYQSRVCTRLIFHRLMGFRQNYWYLVISAFRFKGQIHTVTAIFPEFKLRFVAYRLNSLFLTYSPIPSLFLFATPDRHLASRLLRSRKFVGKFICDHSYRGEGISRFLVPVDPGATILGHGNA